LDEAQLKWSPAPEEKELFLLASDAFEFVWANGQDAWFNTQPEPRPQTVIQIGGEHHLAVHYRNIGRRVIFPFSVVERLQARRERRKNEGSEK
jgi:hypothetical protein